MVNGPPGSGKTAMLRAVVASRWVDAALSGQPCPIVVACGATNQSVMNVIEAFGKAPQPDAAVPHAQRWIDDLPSYGAYRPTSSYMQNPDNEADISRFICIERLSSPATAGFLYRYLRRKDLLNPTHARICEHPYLKRAQHALNDDSLPSVEAAVAAMWDRLRVVVGEAEACLNAAHAGHGWVSAGRRYLALHAAHWAPPRKAFAERMLAVEDVEMRVAAAMQFIDDGISLRFHYRCKPSIIEYCKVLCYDRMLRPQSSELSPFPEPALGWVNIDTEPIQLGDSRCNRPEADALVEWIVERWPAWRSHPATEGKPIKDIVAIVTPYRAQADYLKPRLDAAFDASRGKGGDWPNGTDVSDVKIGTVHRLQGAERPIICFSLVEGPAQAVDSFIDRDKTLMNVAVSRAKSAFIIFANPERT